MNRALITVHMYVSIDGRIDGEFMDEGTGISGDFYDQEIFRISDTNANGSRTAGMYAAKGTVNLSKYSAEGMDYTDWTGNIHADTWNVVFDRKGKLGWEVNYFDYAGRKSQVIEVTTQLADLRYLAFLRSMSIPYIIAGKDDLDPELALIKLKQLFHMERITLCGGAIINGVFLKHHLVDQISLVVSPYVSGDNNAKTAFNTGSEFINEGFTFTKALPLTDGGVQLIFDRKQENRS